MIPTFIDVAREELELGKREVETGIVSVRKVVRSREEVVEQRLTRAEAQIERVAVNRLVEIAPEPRQEGDVMIVPVLEEVLVKRWLVKEELRIRRKVVQTPHRERVVLREEEVVVERKPPGT